MSAENFIKRPLLVTTRIWPTATGVKETIRASNFSLARSPSLLETDLLIVGVISNCSSWTGQK